MFFHCITTHKATYDSVCVEFFPLYSCPCHQVTVLSRANAIPIFQTPRRKIRFPAPSSGVSSVPSRAVKSLSATDMLEDITMTPTPPFSSKQETLADLLVRPLDFDTPSSSVNPISHDNNGIIFHNTN